MKKKLMAFLLVAAMVVSMAGCSKNGGTSKKGGSLIIGQITDLTGDFANGWTNGNADADVKALIGGYGVVAYTRDGTFEVDKTVVKEMKPTDNEDGSRTYTFTINDNLEYNTGLKITAEDYVFGALIGSSPEYAALGAYATSGIDWVGYEEFNKGKTKTFSGVRLLGDYEFSITVKAENIPYFFDLAAVAVGPTPMSIYAPGVTITDDGNGATLSDNFTQELIQGPIESERWNPTVTAGPYQLESYDQANKQAILTINEKYAGTYDGVKPSIEKLIFKKVTEATMMDELASESVDLITSVNGGTNIPAGLDLVEEEGSKIDYTTYLRNGYGKLTFICDFGPTQFPAVRQAIAHCLDRNEFAAQYSGGYAQVVHGFYGLGQWMYTQMKDKIDSELNPYAFNLDKAKELLINDGWTLNAKGNEFVEGVDEVRYKKVDGELMACEIQWAVSEGPVSKLLSTMLPDNLKAVGMKVVPTNLDWSVVSTNLSREGVDKLTYHMYNMGTGFARVSDPYYYYNDSKEYDRYNNNKLYDDKLLGLAKEMRETDSSDKDGYANKWFEFEKRWNELLPDLPLYSDEYHDFFNNKLKDYNVSAHWGAREEIVYAHIE